jgi:hypothetical protein
VNEKLSLFLKLPEYWTVSGKEEVKMENEREEIGLTWEEVKVSNRGEQECEQSGGAGMRARVVRRCRGDGIGKTDTE